MTANNGKIERVIIAVLDTYDKPLTYLDNGAPKALHYYNDELHEYLEGSANTYSFTASADHEDSGYLTEGNKLAFTYRQKDYYLNIMKVVRTETTVEVEAWSLSFELLNEQTGPYKASKAMSFVEYLKAFNFETTILTVNVNEVSDKKITNEWTGTDTILARIFSLANVFSAEAEFLPELNEDFSLKRIVLNVYREHSDTDQGIGKDRTDLVLRYGENIEGITKTSDVTGLYTAIRPTGKDGLTIAGLDKSEYDADGNLEYSSPKGNHNILAVQARDRFPSNLMSGTNDRYIAQIYEYDTDNASTLYGHALAELKKNCVPQVKYEVEGYFDTDIGDTVEIEDQEYTPALYLEARVTEQVRSFTNPALNKTTFDNFVELQSEIDPAILAKVNALIEENKTYDCIISTDNGIVFRNSSGTTTLTANVRNAGEDVTEKFTIQWKKDGVGLAVGRSIIVNASDVEGKAVYGFEAYDDNNKIRGSYEVTVTDVADGMSSHIHIAYANSADGTTGFSVTDGTDKQYMGTYTDFNSADSTDPADYTWVKIKGEKGDQGERGLQGLQGEKGEQGIQGESGKDGRTSYFHIKYSSVASPTTASQMTETPSTYIGTYVDYTETDSTDPSKYTWSRFEGAQGEKGDQGIAGTNGSNGQTSYLHIAYATNETGTSGFSVSDSANKTYIGQYTDFNSADSTDHTKYSWTKIKGDKGDKGDTGATGDTGKDGQMLYATSDTAEATAAKTATLSSGTLTLESGATVAVIFTNANTASSPTLNVAGTGAKAIRTNGVPYAYWEAGATVTFAYDGTYWQCASSPVYASTAVVGNPAGKNVYIGGDGIDIRNGTTVLASFLANVINLGKNSLNSVIKMCGGMASIQAENNALRILLENTYSEMILGIINQASGDSREVNGCIEISGGESTSGINLNAAYVNINGIWIIDLIYPVGSVIENASADFDPNTLYPETTWERIKGKVLIGVDEDDTDFAEAGNTGGMKTNTHNHYQTISNDGSTFYASPTGNTPRTRVKTITRATIALDSKGSGSTREDSTYNETISIMPPYETVYIWKRTA